MNNYTWKNWCCNAQFRDIATALNMSFGDFIERISVFCKEPAGLVYKLARLADLPVRGTLVWKELTRNHILDIEWLYEKTVDYIDSNEEYVALIEQAMFEEEKAMLAQGWRKRVREEENYD